MPEKDLTEDNRGAWRSDPDTVERRDRERPDSGAPAEDAARGRPDPAGGDRSEQKPHPPSTDSANADRASCEKGWK